MTVGEIISLITKQASDLDKDYLLMCKDVYSIDVIDGGIELSFVDGNTQNYTIYTDGTTTY